MNVDKIRSLFGAEAVIDNNIICDFSELGRLDILNSVFSKILIPESIIQKEVIQFRDSLNSLEYSKVSIESFEAYEFMAKILVQHGGLTDCDAEVVTIAYEKYVLCTSNEKRIMTTCKENNIKYTGTLGILCCAYEYSVISYEVLMDLVNKLDNECSCFISQKVLNEVRTFYKKG